jgi:hypothetical protein
VGCELGYGAAPVPKIGIVKGLALIVQWIRSFLSRSPQKRPVLGSLLLLLLLGIDWAVEQRRTGSKDYCELI